MCSRTRNIPFLGERIMNGMVEVKGSVMSMPNIWLLSTSPNLMYHLLKGLHEHLTR